MAIQKIQQLPPRAMKVLDGDIFNLSWAGWFQKLQAVLNSNLSEGYTGTIVTAKLTNTGTEGSMTFTNGILTSQTPAS